jgi:hypothetical protein
MLGRVLFTPTVHAFVAMLAASLLLVQPMPMAIGP